MKMMGSMACAGSLVVFFSYFQVGFEGIFWRKVQIWDLAHGIVFLPCSVSAGTLSV